MIDFFSDFFEIIMQIVSTIGVILLCFMCALFLWCLANAIILDVNQNMIDSDSSSSSIVQEYNYCPNCGYELT